MCLAEAGVCQFWGAEFLSHWICADIIRSPTSTIMMFVFLVLHANHS